MNDLLFDIEILALNARDAREQAVKDQVIEMIEPMGFDIEYILYDEPTQKVIVVLDHTIGGYPLEKFISQLSDSRASQYTISPYNKVYLELSFIWSSRG